MKEKIQHLGRILRYVSKAKHRRGFGVHSPFMFHLITNVIEERFPYYFFDKIERVRNELLANHSSIDVRDFGTGKSGKRKVSSIAAKALKKKKYAQLIFRLANATKPYVIVELGTSLGITTAYLASINSKATVHSFEGCPEIAKLASDVLSKSDCHNVNIHVGDIDINLPAVLQNEAKLDFVFFDANHTKEATLRYFNMCLPKIGTNTVFIFDDIHYTAEMEEAWIEIINHPAVRVTCDMFALGIIYFNPELKKQHYTLLY